MTGIDIIAEERRRQTDDLGWTPEHDIEEHVADGLAKAAAVYATPPGERRMVTRTSWTPGLELPDRGDTTWQEPEGWPFESGSYHPTPNDRIRELAKAGALIAAAIDRIQAGE